MSGEAFGLFSSAMKEKKSSKSKSRASSFANVMLEIEPLIKVQPADDGTLSDFINEFKQADELPQGLSSKTKAFHVFEPEYYINRVKGIESEMVDAIRRRMVPDAKRKITQHVNTYNVLSCDKLEWKVLIAKLEKSAAPESKKVLSYRVRDRGLEAGSTRKGKKYEVSWQNNSPNTFLPVLDNDRCAHDKKRCSKDEPKCSRCMHMKSECVYPEQKTPKRSQKKNSNSSIPISLPVIYGPESAPMSQDIDEYMDILDDVFGDDDQSEPTTLISPPFPTLPNPLDNASGASQSEPTTLISPPTLPPFPTLPNPLDNASGASQSEPTTLISPPALPPFPTLPNPLDNASGASEQEFSPIPVFSKITACLNCRTAKKKCEREGDKCERCKENNLECRLFENPLVAGMKAVKADTRLTSDEKFSDHYNNTIEKRGSVYYPQDMKVLHESFWTNNNIREIELDACFKVYIPLFLQQFMEMSLDDLIMKYMQFNKNGKMLLQRILEAVPHSQISSARLHENCREPIKYSVNDTLDGVLSSGMSFRDYGNFQKKVDEKLKVLVSKSSLEKRSSALNKILEKEQLGWGLKFDKTEVRIGHETVEIHYGTLTQPKVFIQKYVEYLVNNNLIENSVTIDWVGDGRPIKGANTHILFRLISANANNQDYMNNETVFIADMSEKYILKVPKQDKMWRFMQELYAINHVIVDNRRIDLRHILNPDMGFIHKFVTFTDEAVQEIREIFSLTQLNVLLHSCQENDIVTIQQVSTFNTNPCPEIIGQHYKFPVSEYIPNNANELFEVFQVQDDTKKKDIISKLRKSNSESKGLIRCGCCYVNGFTMKASKKYPELSCFHWIRRDRHFENPIGFFVDDWCICSAHALVQSCQIMVERSLGQNQELRLWFSTLFSSTSPIKALTNISGVLSNLETISDMELAKQLTQKIKSLDEWSPFECKFNEDENCEEELDADDEKYENFSFKRFLYRQAAQIAYSAPIWVPEFLKKYKELFEPVHNEGTLKQLENEEMEEDEPSDKEVSAFELEDLWDKFIRRLLVVHGPKEYWDRVFESNEKEKVLSTLYSFTKAFNNLFPSGPGCDYHHIENHSWDFYERLRVSLEMIKQVGSEIQNKIDRKEISKRSCNETLSSNVEILFRSKAKRFLFKTKQLSTHTFRDD
ncbi:hypothetical protein C9374_012882 [Naegleria lovaniensis]|uniref:Zn(2)-C6 fungal-type domain-containing protein n=1 Tax=Naegleria lovaniensis TaxID=51637 RepID=A0AA88GFD5_NAELO|nr:uncharacterized protein C9374_012882 [Naegleria lovaniensis]KAG2373036.1 hypothetical protein C9374_012882 [Naegleria lovaniensis]